MNSQSAEGQLKIFRLSPVVLISRLILVEAALLTMAILTKVPQIIFVETIAGRISTTNTMSLILLIVFSLTEMIIVTMTVLSWANEMYILKGQTIIHKLGVLKTKEEEYSLKNIEALTLDQTFWQRIFNYGDIHFFSPVLKHEYFLTNLSNPKEIRDLIEEAANFGKVSSSGEKIIFRR